VALEGSLGHEHVEAAGAARRDPPAAPLPVPVECVRRRPLGTLAEVAGVEEVEVRVHDMIREVLDVRRVAVRTTAAARAALDTGTVGPRALPDARAGCGAVGDAMAEEEVICDVALGAPRRERDDSGTVAAGEVAQDVDCSRRID
jgi:hypothetical protein